jgi:hypothetical protein
MHVNMPACRTGHAYCATRAAAGHAWRVAQLLTRIVWLPQSFSTESTFTTPSGLYAYNVNYAVQCNSG